MEVPVGTTEILRNAYGYYRTYPYTKVPVGITEFILIRNLYGGICRYYRTYTYTKVPVGTTELILVLRILYLYYGAYPCLTNLLLVLQSLFRYFGSNPCITEHIHVLRILYVYYRTYTCLTEHILTLRIFILCEGTRRYDKSEQIIIVSHTRSD